MAAWISKLIEAFGGEGADTEVRRILDRAQSDRARVEIVDAIACPNNPLRLSTTIEQVREEDIVVSRPTHQGRLRPLATGGKLEIIIGAAGHRIAADTKSLGRIRVQSGNGGMFYGYRLALPTAFRAEERRVAPRMEMDASNAPDAELAMLGLPNPIHGPLRDISSTGVCMHSPNARGRVEAGQRAYLTVHLPEPVGTLKETVNVVRVEETDGGRLELGLAFLRKIPEVEEMLKQARTGVYRWAS